MEGQATQAVDPATRAISLDRDEPLTHPSPADEKLDDPGGPKVRPEVIELTFHVNQGCLERVL